MIDTIHSFFDACHPFGYPLLLCSVLLFTVIFYHVLFVSRGRSKPLNILRRALQERRVAELPTLLAAEKNELSDIILHAAKSGDADTTEARLARLADSWRAGLTLISIITNIAPMLGILGTAWGLVEVFHVFGSPEAQTGIAMGISTALYTTIFGLAIAVPGIVAQSCFERRLERRAAELNELFTELLAQRHTH